MKNYKKHYWRYLYLRPCHCLLIAQINGLRLQLLLTKMVKIQMRVHYVKQKVAATRKSDYGCTIFSLDDNQAIQLKAGTYTLNKELVPNANISIYGYGERGEDKNWTEKTL